jgi:hypothetical protein
MDALPELVRRPFRDHRDVQSPNRLEVLADLLATATTTSDGGRKSQRHHTTLEAHVHLYPLGLAIRPLGANPIRRRRASARRNPVQVTQTVDLKVDGYVLTLGRKPQAVGRRP